MYRPTLIIFGILLALAPMPNFGQTRISIQQYCVFDGSPLTGDLYGFTSDREANEALTRVMRYTGLEPNFVIKAANVPNAVATIQGTQRIILYSQEFMMQVRNTTRTDWSAVSVLAHEVGHHLQGHTLLPGGSRPDIELEADKYSGFVLQKMGASLDQAQAAMRLVGSEQGSPTHPGRQARLAAITNGWMQARDLADQEPTTGPVPERNPPAGPITPPSVPQTVPQTGGTSYIARAVFPGDPIAYYVTSANDIVGLHPQTGQPVPVGRRIPPTVPGFVWMYSTPQITYGVTADGRIINRDHFGNAFQIGYVTGV